MNSPTERLRNRNPGWNRIRIRGAAAFLLALVLATPRVSAQPATPADILSGGLDDTVVFVGWDQASNSSLVTYRLERAFDSEPFVSIAVLGSSEGQYVDDGLDLSRLIRYRIRSFDAATRQFSSYSPEVAAPSFFDTENFRLFFKTSSCPRIDGGFLTCVPPATDATGANAFAARAGATLEAFLRHYRAFGFREPARYLEADKLPVNLGWCDGGGCANSTNMGLGIEFLGPYDPASNTGQPESFVFPAHELFHSIQNAYDMPQGDPAVNWIFEGQARAVQDLACAGLGDPCPSVDDDFTGLASFFAEAQSYLRSPNRPINEISYNSALFWTYLCQRYGIYEFEPAIGLDFLAEFWKEAARDPYRDGIGVIDGALASLGHEDRFPDAFRDFIVANYAKDFPNAPARYRYTDEARPPGSYGGVHLDFQGEIGPGEQAGPFVSDASRWGARYFEITPRAGLEHLRIEAAVEVGTPHPAHFSVLALRGGALVLERHRRAREFSLALRNRGYEKVAIIASGFENDVNFRWAVNASQPVLRLLDPTAATPAFVGPTSAPEKFLAKLEVLDPAGNPVAGIAAEEFAFHIGAEAVPPENVLSAAHVQGQYWFVIQPVVAKSGPHDLVVSWGALADVEDDAVRYLATKAAETVIVIDRSASMLSSPSKLVDAKEAGELYIDSFRSQDAAGVVSFNQASSIESQLAGLSEAAREIALQAIRAISAGGATSIESGLLAGLDQLRSSGSENRDWSLLLLSDGVNTEGRGIPAFIEKWGADVSSGRRVPRVHTVAIGSDSNRPDLQNLAAVTGGTYHFAAEPPRAGMGAGGQAAGNLDFRRDLGEVLRLISERVAAEDQVLSERGTAPAAGVSHTFSVEAGSSELIVAVSWNGGRFLSGLRDPANGTAYVPFRETPTHRVYRITSPRSGSWQITVGTPTCEGCPLVASYLVEASVKSTVRMDLHLGLHPDERYVGNPMPILVSLTERGPVTAAIVQARITYPGGDQKVLALLDDGNHEDGIAGDGVFGNVLRATSEDGTYLVEAAALANAPVAGGFFRRRREAFHLRASFDNDGDCMPESYEVRVGLTPGLPERDEDPDGDGIGNCSEFLLGTLPLDEDSDDDGEADGSEVQGGRNPLEPDDGRVEAPRLCAYPGVEKVHVRYTPSRGMHRFDLYRAQGAGGQFTLLATGVPAKAPFTYTDSTAKNDVLHRYRMAALGSGPVRSAASNVCAAVPRDDPHPPHGAIFINGGAVVTDSVKVEITLPASDDLDYESPVGRIIDPDGVKSGVSEMSIANTPDRPQKFVPHEPTIDWLLAPDARGIATVYATFRDKAGNVSDLVHATIRVVSGPPDEGFIRGDIDAGGVLNISDAIQTLGFLFLGEPADLSCAKSSDANDDGRVDLSDAVRLLGFLFLGADPPPAPFGACGSDPTPDSLTCDSYPRCG